MFWKELCFTKKRTFMQIRDNKIYPTEKNVRLVNNLIKL
nr:MAG TPA: hypothetical protein [Caudoviricetes sp.]